MAITTISSREFNQQGSSVLRAAERGPVYITKRGERRFVVTTVADYNENRGPQRTLTDALWSDDPLLGEIEDPPARLRTITARDARRMRELDELLDE